MIALNCCRLLAVAAAAFFFAAMPARAQRFETAAPTAILMDSETGAVLFEKAADEPTPPASMAKLMTALVLFDEMAKGRVTPDTEFVVSENAWRKGGAPSGGSTMFAALNSRIKVSDLIPGLIVLSGNDAAIVLAEGIAGSEANFAGMMTAR
ncbi:MAG: D-alanyl-D-alanine carboxypeptidase family protein, partial [Beijerinckiaceae bacterium]